MCRSFRPRSAKGFGKAISKQTSGDLDRAGRDGGKKFGGGMLGAAKSFAAPLAALFAVGAGVAFFKGAIDGASDLSESASKVGVVFGKQAGQIMAASETSAKAMGLSKAAYLGATGTLGNLLVSLKVAPQAAADMSQEMVKLAGDMASFNNVPIEDALAAIKSGLTGETEPLKAFGVNMNDATLKAQALKMGLIKTTKDAMDPQTKALAAQSLIMAQTGTAQGDFSRTSGGLANQQRILAAQFADVKAKIGAVLLPAFTSAVTYLNTNLTPAFTELQGGIRALVAAFQAGGSDITSSGFAGGMERIGLATRAFVENTKSFAAGMQEHSTALLGAAGVITTVFIPALLRMALTATISGAETIAIWAMLQASSIASAVSSAAAFFIVNSAWIVSAATATASGIAIAAAWLFAFWPVALVIAAVVGLGILIWKNMDRIKGWIGAAWTWIKGITTTVWTAISGFFTGLWASISGGVSTAWASVVAFVSGIWTAISGFVVKLATAALAIFNSMTYPFRLAIAVVIGIFLILNAAIMAAIGWLVGAVVAGWNALWAMVAPIVNGIKDFVVGVWNAIVGFVVGIVSRLVAGIVGYFRRLQFTAVTIFIAVRTFLTGVWNTIFTAVSGVVGRIWGAVSGAFNKVSSVVGSVMGTIKGVISSAWNTIWGTISGIAGRISGAVSGAFNGIKDAIGGALGGAVSAASSLVGKVFEAIKGGFGKIASIGSDLVSGLINGITGAGGKLKDAITNFIRDHVPAPVRKVLGIASPSKVFAELGRNTVSGFIVGVDDKAGALDAQMRSLVSVPRPGTLDFATPAQRATAVRGGGDDGALLAAVNGLRADIQRLPRDYQMGQRQFAGAR